MKTSRLSGAMERLEPRCLLSAGDLDPTFGNHGTITYSQFGPPVGMAVEADERILVADANGVRRFNADGTLDEQFGGHSRGGIAAKFSVSGFALLPNGRIVLGGTINDGEWVVARFLPDGKPDRTFGPNGSGYAFAPILNAQRAYSYDSNGGLLAVQTDGKILLSSDEVVETLPGVVPGAGLPGVTYGLVRFTAGGNVDTSFANNGQIDGSSATGLGIPEKVFVTPQGNIVVTGTFSFYGISHGFADEFDAGGHSVPHLLTPVPTNYPYFDLYDFTSGFADSGGNLALTDSVGEVLLPSGKYVHLSFDPAYPGDAEDVIPAPGGKVFVAGSEGYTRVARPTIERLNADGTANMTFGFYGSTVVPIPRKDNGTLTKVVQTPSGDLLAAGSVNGRLLLARIQGGSHPVPYHAPAAILYGQTFQVAYTAERALIASTIKGRDLIITGPNHFITRAAFRDFYDPQTNMPDFTPPAGLTTLVADYDPAALGGPGLYRVIVPGRHVRDVGGLTLPGGVIGTFHVA